MLHADLFLDTFYCNAHTVASDALWAGLPILSLPGLTFQSRVSGSLLKQLNLDELIAINEKDYEQKAVDFCINPFKLNNVNVPTSSPLCYRWLGYVYISSVM